MNDILVQRVAPSSERRRLNDALRVTSARGQVEPHPLPPSLLPVAAYDHALMPDALRPWVSDVTERMQCPPDFVAVAVIAALGSVIGRQVAIRPKSEDDWTEVANIWAMTIGRPGIMKSPAIEEALRPVKRLALAAEADYRAELSAHAIGAQTAKLRQDANRKDAFKRIKEDRSADVSELLAAGDETAEPTLRRYLTNDTSLESLGVLLQQNPNGLLVHRDELVSLLDHLDAEEHVSQRGFFLTSWSGMSRYTFDRIGRGFNLSIEGVCISMLGGTPPGQISQYLARALRGGRGDDGLIQRFGLLVWPDVSGDWHHIDRRPDSMARDMAHALFERLANLDWRAIGAKRDRGPDGDEEGLPYPVRH